MSQATLAAPVGAAAQIHHVFWWRTRSQPLFRSWLWQKLVQTISRANPDKTWRIQGPSLQFITAYTSLGWIRDRYSGLESINQPHASCRHHHRRFANQEAVPSTGWALSLASAHAFSFCFLGLIPLDPIPCSNCSLSAWIGFPCPVQPAPSPSLHPLLQGPLYWPASSNSLLGYQVSQGPNIFNPFLHPPHAQLCWTAYA